MASFNKVIIMGNLCRDPDQKFTGTGLAISSFTIAINEKRKEEETVTFVDATAFGKTAETICQYFRKGNPILIEGKLRQENWTDKQTNQKRSKLGVTVDSFTFVGGKQEEAKPRDDQSTTPPEKRKEAGEEEEDSVPF